jgi:aminopeptidase YwaD
VEVRVKKSAALILAGVLLAGLAAAQPREPLPQTLLSWEVLRAIINESSGDLALQNEIAMSGVNRNRKPEEYLKGYYETAFLLDKLKEYGIDEASIYDLPLHGASKTTWDAEMAELWIVEPDMRKIADLDDLPASLCQGSATTDATGELVYVGPGNKEEHYKDKDVKGKIVLVNGWVDGARRLAVEKFGALGVVAWSASHPEYDRDEVGWGGINPGEKEKPTFGFMVSQRQGQDLRDALERGQKIVLRAIVKAQQVPYKEEMTVGLIKGKDFPEEEIVFTAHVFEGFAKQGANDDISGCAAILETARVLKKLVAAGHVPPLRRSVRFLFVPEISGTAAYIKANPAIAKRFFANINHDMVGEGLIKNLSAFRVEQSPLSLPTYLNDVVASFTEWVGATQRIAQDNGWRSLGILSPNGSRDPFPYTIDAFSGGSDHIVFVDGSVRVPAVMFIVWPDMWYHTSGDTPDKSDSTQLKRVVALSAACAVFLANAGPEDAEKIMAEVAARQAGRLGQHRAKAERLLLAADAKGVTAAYKEALNIVLQSVVREKASLATARFFFKGDAALENALRQRLDRIEALKALYLKDVDGVYALRCERLKTKPVKPVPTADEARLGRVVPARTAKMGDVISAWEMRDELQKIKYQPTPAVMRSESELRNYIDGARSVLDIRNAASAAAEPIPLADVEAWVNALEKVGAVELRKK